MAKIDEPRTGYDLPFTVRHPGASAWSDGGDLEGVLRWKPEQAGAAEEIPRPLDLLARLARSGALAGRSIAPEKSGFEFVPPEIRPGGTARFLLRSCRVDAGSILVLTNLLLARSEALPLISLDLARPGTVAATVLAKDPEERSTFPGRNATISFPIEDEQPESGTYTFTATIETPLAPDHRKWLNQALADWIDAVQAGAYALAPLPPADCWAEADAEGVVDWDHTVEWSVFKVRADELAVDALVNIFAALHGRGQRVVRLAIS
ncbi:MAG: hypothetical protein HY716_16150 [Planctomycetes bacterium]|nr:hypothetical protein [Planctomycetota bacterium]